MKAENPNQAAIRSHLQEILVTGSLRTEPAELEACANSNPLMKPGMPPTCIVCPGYVDELQAILSYANQADLNLTVTSSSGAHVKGGIANQAENILIDLSHWRKIDLIDRRNRVCRVEPGVTYGELLARLNEHAMTLPMPLAPRQGKSVLAAVMDREPATWPRVQWDSSDPVGSSEFYFGQGDRFRTGAAGGPGTIQQQRDSGGALKHSSGPSQTDFHRVLQGAQGSMGILTWITLRTELKPSVQQTSLVGAERLGELLPFVYAVQRGQLGEESFILNRTAAAMLVAQGDRGSYEAISASLPGYVCLQNVAGFERLPDERLAYQLEAIEGFAHQFGLQLKSSIGELSAADLLAKSNAPCGKLDWRHTLLGHCLSIFFLSTLDRTPPLQQTFLESAEEYGVSASQVGMYIQPIVQNHGCHMELMVPFDPGSSEDVSRMVALEKHAVARLIAAGAYFSRPYGSAAELVWSQNPANYQLVKTVKTIFDPGRVLQRGKWDL